MLPAIREKVNKSPVKSVNKFYEKINEYFDLIDKENENGKVCPPTVEDCAFYLGYKSKKSFESFVYCDKAKKDIRYKEALHHLKDRVISWWLKHSVILGGKMPPAIVTLIAKSYDRETYQEKVEHDINMKVQSLAVTISADEKELFKKEATELIKQGVVYEQQEEN